MKNKIGIPMRIGFDRMMFTLDVREYLACLDMEKLKGKSIVYKKADEGAEMIILDTGELVKINKVQGHIEGLGDTVDNYVVTIDYGGKKGEQYMYVTVNLPKLVYQSNELNLSEESIITEVPRMIKHILEVNGVTIPIENCNVSSVELNYNIYGDFMNSFRLINMAWKHYGYKVFKADNKEIESLCLKMSNFSIKVYDKTSQIIESGMIPLTDEKCSRVEVKINRSSEVQRILNGNNNIVNVMESVEVLRDYYTKVIEKYIIKQAEGLKKDIEKEIFNMLKIGEKPSKVFKHMMYELAIDEPVSMVDVEFFENAMKKYYKKQGKANVSRDIKKQLNTLTEKQYNKLSNNMKYIELLKENLSK